MSSIVPRSDPRTPRAKLRRPSYRGAVEWIARCADVESTRDVHLTVRLVASIFGRTEQHVLVDVVKARRREER